MTSPESRLTEALSRHTKLTVAVSGGVDSLTLASFAGRQMPITVAHAVSPAVPAEATDRVRKMAKAENWALHVIDAQEFNDPSYLKNPLNRCYFCKANLYARIREITDAPIAAGTNTDDLSDYRPGLIAAKEHGIVHPFVEANISKSDLRTIARYLDLEEIAELPAQPCLASRVETGIAISPQDLQFIYQVEGLVRRENPLGDHRCRLTSAGVRLESNTSVTDSVMNQIEALCQEYGRAFIGLHPYSRGSAFLTEATL